MIRDYATWLAVTLLCSMGGCAAYPPTGTWTPPLPSTTAAVTRGQSPSYAPTPGSTNHLRYPMAVSGNTTVLAQNTPPSTLPPPPPGSTTPPGALWGPPPSPPSPPEPSYLTPGGVPYAEPLPMDGLPPISDPGPLPPPVDIDVYVEEARTGRFMFGMGVNSDLGVTGQIVVDERNFDWRNPPTSWQDIVNGTAFRGGGQGFRLEAMPGNQVQRYLASFTQPYLYLPGFSDPFTLSTSGYFFDRRYYDWDEQRLGGRLGLGYRLTHDLSLTTSMRMENVYVHDPRVIGLVPELDEVLGDNSLFSGGITLTHDTRDSPFAATEGHLIELNFEQAFGTFDYPRGELDFRQYFLMRERPDGSGRHTLAYSFRVGVSGSQTPIYENYFAGGYTTLRGFDFRGASPVGAAGVEIGGAFRFLGSVEYMFPFTADDMVKGVVFCDYGTVETDVRFDADTFRVAPGFGLRIAIPAMGPAPLALDFAFPVAHAPFDDIENFSFFFGFGR